MAMSTNQGKDRGSRLPMIIQCLSIITIFTIGFLSLAPSELMGLSGYQILSDGVPNISMNDNPSQELPTDTVPSDPSPKISISSTNPITINSSSAFSSSIPSPSSPTSSPIPTSIDSLHEEWRQLLYDFYIFPELITPLFEHDQYSASSPTFHALLHRPNLSPSDALNIFQQLISKTLEYLQSQSISDSNFAVNHHRKLLFIRRGIMILHQFIDSVFDHDNNGINVLSYSPLIGGDSVLNNSIFGDIHNVFLHLIGAKEGRGNNGNNKLNKYWFLIHLSKSAGSTICGTQQHIGYQELPPNVHSNCNIPGHKTPLKNKDQGPYSCAEIESKRKSSGNIEFVASERPITGHKVSDIPTLCDEYLYLFPIRDPLHRIASSLAEFNLPHYFPFQFLIKRSEFKSKGLSNLKLYHDRLMVLHNNVYGSLKTANHYSTFVSHLFANDGIRVRARECAMILDKVTLQKN